MYLIDKAATASLGQHDCPRERVGVAQRPTRIARLRPNEPCFVHRSRRAESGEVELICAQKIRSANGDRRSTRTGGAEMINGPWRKEAEERD